MTNLEFIEHAAESVLKECPENVDTEAYCHISSGDYDYGNGTLVVGEVSGNGDNFSAWLNSEYQEVDIAKDFMKYLNRHNLTIDDYLTMREVWNKMDAEIKYKILKENLSK